MTEYVVGWIGLALINAALANADGRSPLKYFLASLFLGPIVTIVLATTKEDQGALRQVDLWNGRAGVRPKQRATDEAATSGSIPPGMVQNQEKRTTFAIVATVVAVAGAPQGHIRLVLLVGRSGIASVAPACEWAEVSEVISVGGMGCHWIGQRIRHLCILGAHS